MSTYIGDIDYLKSEENASEHESWCHLTSSCNDFSTIHPIPSCPLLDMTQKTEPKTKLLIRQNHVREDWHVFLARVMKPFPPPINYSKLLFDT